MSRLFLVFSFLLFASCSSGSSGGGGGVGSSGIDASVFFSETPRAPAGSGMGVFDDIPTTDTSVATTEPANVRVRSDRSNVVHLDGTEYTFSNSHVIPTVSGGITAATLIGQASGRGNQLSVSLAKVGVASLVFFVEGENFTSGTTTIDSLNVLATGTPTPTLPSASVRYEGDYSIFGILGGGTSRLRDSNTPTSGVLGQSIGTFDITVDFLSATGNQITGTARGSNGSPSGTFADGDIQPGSRFSGLEFTGSGLLSNHDFTLSGGFFGRGAAHIAGAGSDAGRDEVMGFIGSRTP